MCKKCIPYPLLLLILINGCVEIKPPQLPPASQLQAEWEQMYREKDEHFKTSDASPLTDSLKADFTGLKYYPFNPNLVFMVKLNEHYKKKKLKMATSTGEPRDYFRFGYFEFTVKGKLHRLSIYKSEEPHLKEHLFLPFTDETTGKETYGAGRYLELESRENDYYILNFNNAYNPYCVYSDEYSCPIPPRENKLSISIRAGEKIFKKLKI